MQTERTQVSTDEDGANPRLWGRWRGSQGSLEHYMRTEE